MFLHYHLFDRVLNDLEFEHRYTTDKCYADQVKTDYLLGEGWSVMKIVEALLIGCETVCNHVKRYRKGGLPALQKHEEGGNDAALNKERQHLRTNGSCACSA